MFLSVRTDGGECGTAVVARPTGVAGILYQHVPVTQALVPLHDNCPTRKLSSGCMPPVQFIALCCKIPLSATTVVAEILDQYVSVTQVVRTGAIT